MTKDLRVESVISLLFIIYVAWVHLGSMFNWTLSGPEGSVNFVYFLYYWIPSLSISVIIYMLSFRNGITRSHRLLFLFISIVFIPIFFGVFHDSNYDVSRVGLKDYIEGIKILFIN